MKPNVRLQPMEFRLQELKLAASEAGVSGELVCLIGPLTIRVPIRAGDCEPLDELVHVLENWVLKKVPMFEPQGELGPDTGVHSFPVPAVLITEEEGSE